MPDRLTPVFVGRAVADGEEIILYAEELPVLSFGGPSKPMNLYHLQRGDGQMFMLENTDTVEIREEDFDAKIKLWVASYAWTGAAIGNRELFLEARPRRRPAEEVPYIPDNIMLGEE